METFDDDISPGKRARVMQYKTKGLVVRTRPHELNLCRCAGNCDPGQPNWCKNESHKKGCLCDNVITEKGARRCNLCSGKKASPPKQVVFVPFGHPSLYVEPYVCPQSHYPTLDGSLHPQEGFSQLLHGSPSNVWGHGLEAALPSKIQRPSPSRKMQSRTTVATIDAGLTVKPEAPAALSFQMGGGSPRDSLHSNRVFSQKIKELGLLLGKLEQDLRVCRAKFCELSGALGDAQSRESEFGAM